jgi:hypothetical protein
MHHSHQPGCKACDRTGKNVDQLLAVAIEAEIRKPASLRGCVSRASPGPAPDRQQDQRRLTDAYTRRMHAVST